MLTRVKKPIIYLAGKIAPDDWRSEIFGHRIRHRSERRQRHLRVQAPAR